MPLFPDPGPWKHPEPRPVELTSPLGLDSLPAQRFTQVKRTTFTLNLMVVGESGLGKTTFMNTLFNSDLTEEIVPKNPQHTQTVQIQPSHYELDEDGVLLKLCIVDTPGFGDQLNREHNLAPIIEYIDKQFEEYMVAERHPGFRKKIPDTRIHAVLYFIAPNGHGLKELDSKALKLLSSKVNVIPLIAKADTMTVEEKRSFKSILLRDLEHHSIKTFPSSYPDEVDGADELLQHIPFSVIGSDNTTVIGNRRVRCRTYRWGVVEVENAEHCDFVYLRELLMSTCLDDLIETTHNVHYHRHRGDALRSKGRPVSIMECDDTYEVQIEGTKQKNHQDLQYKEAEIRKLFVERVKNKELELREREEKLNAKRAELMAELDEYRAMIEAEERDLEDVVALNTLSRSATLSKSASKLFRPKQQPTA
ncbi:MAG: septin [Benniella sp.]|nr:MAG: septin [Benniella sp.]